MYSLKAFVGVTRIKNEMANVIGPVLYQDFALFFVVTLLSRWLLKQSISWSQWTWRLL